MPAAAAQRVFQNQFCLDLARLKSDAAFAHNRCCNKIGCEHKQVELRCLEYATGRR